jgi:hypothetical protein
VGVSEQGAEEDILSKTGETNGDGRRLHNGHLHELHSSSCLIWMIKPRRTRQAGHVKRMRGSRYGYSVLGRNLRERNHLKDMGAEGIIILKVRLQEIILGVWLMGRTNFRLL